MDLINRFLNDRSNEEKKLLKFYRGYFYLPTTFIHLTYSYNLFNYLHQKKKIIIIETINYYISKLLH